jgi:hypothetical protein
MGLLFTPGGVWEKNKEQGHSGPLADEGREGKEAPRTKGLRATYLLPGFKGGDNSENGT